MSQSDFNIDNVSRSLFRAENNTSLQALASLSSGATEPTTPYAYQFWADTSSGLLKLRNAANTDWIAKGLLSAVDWGYLASSGGTVSGDVILSGSSLIETEGASVTASSTTDIWATDGNTIHITGNTTITSFGTAPQAGAWMKLVFDGTPQLTQSADLNLNAGGANITIQAGDIAFVYADTATQMDVIVHRKSGEPIVPVTYASNADYVTGTEAAKALSPSVARARNLVAGTIVPTTSGTSIDFTGLPSWVKRITIMLSGTSTSGVSNWIFQIGDSGGIETTGYLGTGSFCGATTGATVYTAGFGLPSAAAGNLMYGALVISRQDEVSNTWVSFGVISSSNSAFSYIVSGSKQLTAALDRVRLTTVGGTDTFDAGSINIIYE
jgi:hypothetical protein